MTINFIEPIGALGEQRKIYFYELLAHFLTFSMRGILFSEAIPEDERVERAKWLNEIAHRTTYNIFVLTKKKTDYSEEEFWQMILQNAKKHPKTKEDVVSAIEQSYGYVIENESDAAGIDDEQLPVLSHISQTGKTRPEHARYGF